jgi:hypothetical protein
MAMLLTLRHEFTITMLGQAPKPVPEAVKQGVETPQDKNKKKAAKGEATAAKGEASASKASTKATSSPQFEAFIRRIRGGK